MTEPRAVYNVPGKPEPKEWRCLDCHYILGHIEMGKLQLVVGRGGITVSVIGYAEATCPVCGKIRNWSYLGRRECV